MVFGIFWLTPARDARALVPILQMEKLRLRSSGFAHFPQLVQMEVGFRLGPADAVPFREGSLLSAAV